MSEVMVQEKKVTRFKEFFVGQMGLPHKSPKGLLKEAHDYDNGLNKKKYEEENFMSFADVFFWMAKNNCKLASVENIHAYRKEHKDDGVWTLAMTEIKEGKVLVWFIHDHDHILRSRRPLNDRVPRSARFFFD